MAIITLLTDFGSKNGFSGVLKGVIWSIAPGTQIADISHEITPQNIMEGAITLWRAATFFPAGTIHVAVVDPGVGTSRRPIAAKIGKQYFVGPDNGIFTLFIQQAEVKGEEVKIFLLDEPGYWLPEVSHTFHGRDIFSPVAAHLAAGVPLEKMGTHLNDLIRLDVPQPIRTEKGWRGQVMLIDVFGNIATNFHADLIEGKMKISLIIGEISINGLVASYGAGKPGEVVALIDSENFLEVATVNGNCAQKLNVGVGDPVELIYK